MNDALTPHFYALTLAFFEEHGIKYKPLRELTQNPGCPTWSNGKVNMPPNCEPGAIAHEMGHGAHELWRDTPRWGEDFANAIRYFVERSAGGLTDWYINQNKSTSNVFLLASDFDIRRFLMILYLGEGTLERAIRESYYQ